MTGGPTLELLAGVDRGADHDVDRRLELAAERRPDVGEPPVLRRRQPDRERNRQSELGQRTVEQLGRQRVVLQETRSSSADSSRCSSSGRWVQAVTR